MMARVRAREGRLERVGIERERGGVDVHEDRLGAGHDDRGRRGHEGERRRDHLVARPDADRGQRQAQRVGARAHAHAVPHAGQRGQLGLQRLTLRPEDEPAGRQHTRHRVHELGLQRRVLPGEIEKRNHRAVGSFQRAQADRRPDRPAHAEQVQREAHLVVTAVAVHVLEVQRPAVEADVRRHAALHEGRRPHVVVVGVLHAHKAGDVDAEPGDQEVEVPGIIVAGADRRRHRARSARSRRWSHSGAPGRACCRRGRSRRRTRSTGCRMTVDSTSPDWFFSKS